MNPFYGLKRYGFLKTLTKTSNADADVDADMDQPMPGGLQQLFLYLIWVR